MQQDKIIEKIEKMFKVPERVAHQIKVIAEKVRGGYVVFESRPQWDNPAGEWTKLDFAKFVFHNPLQKWKLYWKRASGKWEYYDERKTINGILKIIKQDKHGCFWG